MKRQHSTWAALALALAMTVPMVARAQSEVEEDDSVIEDIGESVERGPGESEPPLPPPPPPDIDDGSASAPQQADAVRASSYGRQGVLELGGSLGLSWTERAFALSIAPQVGLFVIDNLEVSVLVDLRYLTTEDGDGRRTDSTRFMALLEPSYHFGLTRELFLFAGLGLGGGYDGLDGGFAIAPRIGTNIVIGSSGLLTPAVQLTYLIGGVEDFEGRSVITATPSFSLNVGYTVFW